MQTNSFYLLFVDKKKKKKNLKWFTCQYFLISSTFDQYRDNTDNRDNFGHYNCDEKLSYRYIPINYLHVLTIWVWLGFGLGLLACNYA